MLFASVSVTAQGEFYCPVIDNAERLHESPKWSPEKLRFRMNCGPSGSKLVFGPLPGGSLSTTGGSFPTARRSGSGLLWICGSPCPSASYTSRFSDRDTTTAQINKTPMDIGHERYFHQIPPPHTPRCTKNTTKNLRLAEYLCERR